MQLGIMKDLQHIQEVSLPYTPASRLLLDRLFAEDFQLVRRWHQLTPSLFELEMKRSG